MCQLSGHIVLSLYSLPIPVKHKHMSEWSSLITEHDRVCILWMGGTKENPLIIWWLICLANYASDKIPAKHATSCDWAARGRTLNKHNIAVSMRWKNRRGICSAREWSSIRVSYRHVTRIAWFSVLNVQPELNKPASITNNEMTSYGWTVCYRTYSTDWKM